MKILTETYKEKISLTLICYDMLLISGSLREISYAQGITSYFYANQLRIFDYAKFAEPYKEKIRSNAESIAKEDGIEVEFIRKSSVRKEAIIAKKIKERGTHPGIVHIISAMETCTTFKPWHDKRTGRTFLKPDQSKCLHYYFYFIDEFLGLCYVRVPTWCPFRLQIYLNGHNILANELKQNDIAFTMIDNIFDSIADANKAQELSDNLSIEKIQRKLDEFAWRFCPVYKDYHLHYHWSIMQSEYATDIVFNRQADLQKIYSELVATAIHTVKPENIATFLGHKLDDRFQGEIGNNYNVRIEGSHIKHSMKDVSIKMYDKFSKILRIETTTNNVSLFKHYREVVHRDVTTSNQMAPLKKSIYSLPFLKDQLKAANKRYLEFIAAFDNKEVGRKMLEKITETKTVHNRNYRGFNFFSKFDLSVLFTIVRGEFTINGFRNKHLRNFFDFSSGKVSWLLRRLLVHGLIKKAHRSYKYYLTALGKEAIAAAQLVKEVILVPAFNF